MAQGLSILLGNGDGTFQAALDYVAGSTPSSVAVGDFNGDGFLDVAVLNPDAVVVLLGNGDGTFQMPHSYGIPTDAVCVAAGDFNGDGIFDLAVVSNSSAVPGVVTIMLGRGDGSFQVTSSFPTGQGSNFVVVADFNGDGKLDIVTSNYATGPFGHANPPVIESDVWIFLGNGDGTFQEAGAYAIDVGPRSVAVGDSNGDGIPDLAVSSYNSDLYSPSGAVSILLGNGDGTFQAAQNYAVGPELPRL